MSKVKPIVKEYNTAKEQAEFFFNREFNTIDSELVKNSEGYFDIVRPSTHLIMQDYFDAYGNEEELREQFEEDMLNEGESYADEQFFDWVEENNSEFDDYMWGDWQDYNYPMWGYVFGCDRFYIDSDYMDVDKLYELGIGVLDHDTGYYLFISGAGYDFYEAHWIPLFKKLGWIEEVKVI